MSSSETPPSSNNPMPSPNAIVDRLLVGYLANAKQYYEDAQCQELASGHLRSFLALATEAISLEDLTDKIFIRHALDKLLSKQGVEETLLHIFLLHSYKLSINSSHPLERGIIKQKIDAIIPRFKQAFDKDLIPEELFQRNIDALLHIAEGTSELPALHKALSAEYQKFNT